MIVLYIPLMQWILKKTLNKIEEDGSRYYAKLKANQKTLLKKAITISNSKIDTDIYIFLKLNKMVKV